MMTGVAEQRFAGDAHSPAAARGFVRGVIGDVVRDPVPPSLCDDLELVVSELVTNAVRAGSSTVGVSIALEGDRVVLRVSDEAGGWPEPRDAGVYDTGGRGLPLVSAISASWGVRLAGDGGKVVWAELLVPPSAPTG